MSFMFNGPSDGDENFVYDPAVVERWLDNRVKSSNEGWLNGPAVVEGWWKSFNGTPSQNTSSQNTPSQNTSSQNISNHGKGDTKQQAATEATNSAATTNSVVKGVQNISREPIKVDSGYNDSVQKFKLLHPIRIGQPVTPLHIEDALLYAFQNEDLLMIGIIMASRDFPGVFPGFPGNTTLNKWLVANEMRIKPYKEAASRHNILENQRIIDKIYAGNGVTQLDIENALFEAYRCRYLPHAAVIMAHEDFRGVSAEFPRNTAVRAWLAANEEGIKPLVAARLARRREILALSAGDTSLTEPKVTEPKVNENNAGANVDRTSSPALQGFRNSLSYLSYVGYKEPNGETVLHPLSSPFLGFTTGGVASATAVVASTQSVPPTADPMNPSASEKVRRNSSEH